MHFAVLDAGQSMKDAREIQLLANSDHRDVDQLLIDVGEFLLPVVEVTASMIKVFFGCRQMMSKSNLLSASTYKCLVCGASSAEVPHGIPSLGR